MKAIFTDLWKFLTFRADQKDYERFGLWHFAVGFCFTWMVGILRNWDFPEAPIWAKLGLGSLVYIFLLTSVMWVSNALQGYENLSFTRILTVISMTAPPAVIYGIPVEAFMSLEGAQYANLCFLCIVALWRVTLFVHFLCVAGGNFFGRAMLVVFAPICLIALGLLSTGRIKYTIDLMGGLNRQPSGPNDAADALLLTLGFLSVPGLLMAIVALIVDRIRGQVDD